MRGVWRVDKETAKAIRPVPYAVSSIGAVVFLTVLIRVSEPLVYRWMGWNLPNALVGGRAWEAKLLLALYFIANGGVIAAILALLYWPIIRFFRNSGLIGVLPFVLVTSGLGAISVLAIGFYKRGFDVTSYEQYPEVIPELQIGGTMGFA